MKEKLINKLLNKNSFRLREQLGWSRNFAPLMEQKRLQRSQKQPTNNLHSG
jgi:hypothetical protein